MEYGLYMGTERQARLTGPSITELRDKAYEFAVREGKGWTIKPTSWAQPRRIDPLGRTMWALLGATFLLGVILIGLLIATKGGPW